jgi:predicted DNA-binding protein YlxM (UPF0122 family)
MLLERVEVSMPTPQDILDNQVEISELFHIYGSLLSDRQKTFIQLYYDENLSLSEIAAQHDISRQAVHDAIKHGRRALFRYESTLHLLDMKSNRRFGSEDSEWKTKVGTILEEMENSIQEEGTTAKGRLLAQVASLRDLVDIPRNSRPQDDSSDEEEAV